MRNLQISYLNPNLTLILTIAKLRDAFCGLRRLIIADIATTSVPIRRMHSDGKRWLLTYYQCCTAYIQDQLENVAINDVLPLKAARRDAIANSKRLWGLRRQRPNFDGYIHIYYAVPP